MLTQPYQRQFSRQSKGLNDCNIIDLGLIAYNDAFQFQLKKLNERINNKCCDILIICEHPAVFTLGRLANKENILTDEDALASQNLKVIRVNRGGDVTFHGPGQLVAYPIFDLAKYKKDLRYFLNRLEETAIQFLKYFGVEVFRRTNSIGAWFNDYKIASIGIGVKKWVSFHGLAININTDLRYFSYIKPCGLDIKMTSLQGIKHYKINMQHAKRIIVDKFASIFGLKIDEKASRRIVGVG